MQANGKDNIGGKKEKPGLILNGLALMMHHINHPCARTTWKTICIFQ